MSEFNKHVKMVAEANHWAKKSKDPSTKVGVVIVPAGTDLPLAGFNGFPRGVNDDEDGKLGRWERPIKYSFVEHAERNAIYNAAKLGLSTDGATMYFNWEPVPCADCARAIIQSGIKLLVGYGSRKFPGKGTQWEESLKVSRIMLREAGVAILDLSAVERRQWPYLLEPDYLKPLPSGLVFDGGPEAPDECCGRCHSDPDPLPRVEGFFGDENPRCPRGER
jgi:dCMP deaminase